MDNTMDTRVGQRTVDRKWQEESDRSETFSCPCCGKETAYDPFRCTSRGQREEHDRASYWYLYVLVECQHCLNEEMVFWMRARLNLT
jgi:hypothetical protein